MFCDTGLNGTIDFLQANFYFHHESVKNKKYCTVAK